MKHKSFSGTLCPIARGLDRVGECWSILILRDAFYGYTRFDEFQQNLGIAPNMLTRRLRGLVEAGMLERRCYSERPPRYEYVLTERGRDFRPVLVALMAWGNRQFAEEGIAIYLADARSGKRVDPVLIDRESGEPIGAHHVVHAGPAANEAIRQRVERVREQAHADAAPLPAMRAQRGGRQ